MNNDDTNPAQQSTASTSHKTTRLHANATSTSDLICGGSVEGSGMSAYMVAVPCETDWINDSGSLFASSFWRTVLPIMMRYNNGYGN